MLWCQWCHCGRRHAAEATSTSRNSWMCLSFLIYLGLMRWRMYSSWDRAKVCKLYLPAGSEVGWLLHSSQVLLCRPPCSTCYSIHQYHCLTCEWCQSHFLACLAKNTAHFGWVGLALKLGTHVIIHKTDLTIKLKTFSYICSRENWQFFKIALQVDVVHVPPAI